MKGTVLSVLALLALGCSSVIRTIPPITPAQHTPAAERRIRAAAARVDITPPPGPSTFGHGPDAIATQGFWTHLECRVFVLEAGGERYAIIPCDLPAISYALYRDVAERAKAVVPGDHILITATHAHAGPAHYFESAAYSGFLSTRRPGFDDDMLQMLSRRIASGIDEAASRLVDAELRWVTTNVWGMTRNRSLDAFKLNGRHPAQPKWSCEGQDEAPELAVPDAEGFKALQEGPCKYLGSACEAIDPLLQTLEIRHKSGRPIGSMTFFAMHPTVLPAHTRLFGADVFGVASRELEASMRTDWAKEARRRHVAEDSDPLAAIVNTNEGDITPTWVAGNVDEARLIGRELARRALRAHADADQQRIPYTDNTFLDSRVAEADMAAAASRLMVDRGRPAELGQGSSHGGSDHATTIDDIFARLPDWTYDGTAQAPKASLLSWLQPPLVARDGFPSRVSFSVWRIADRWIAGVPAELTMTSGYRVRRGIERVTGATHDHTIIAGLAGGYLQYVATCEEFQLQRYEGGSTLYGPLTQRFISSTAAKLACELSANGARNCGQWPASVHPPPFDALPLEPTVDRTGERFPQPRDAVTAEEQHVCRLPQRAGDPPRFCFRWLDEAPGNLPFAFRDRGPGPWLRVRASPAGKTIRWNTKDPRSFVDDWNDDFETKVRTECPDDRYSYTSLFSPTIEEWSGMQAAHGPGKSAFVLAVSTATADRLGMTFGEDSDACTDEEILFCSDDYDSATAMPDIACRQRSSGAGH